jgi:hypothetical protein
MDLTSLELPEKLVLRALFELAQCDRPAHSDVVARLLGLGAAVVDRLFARLALRGLVDAERARLTLAGLAVALRVPALPAAAVARLYPAEFVADDDLDEEVPLALYVLPGERGSHG